MKIQNQQMERQNTMPDKLKLSEKNFEGWESRIGLRILPETLKEDAGETIVTAVITSEKACEVVDWERWELVNEMLLMDGCVMPETKQIPLLDSHQRFQISNIKGSVRNLRIEGTDLVGDVHFDTEAKNEIRLVKDGHLTDLSAGYRISPDETVEIPPQKEVQVVLNGKIINIKNNDMKKRLLARTKWWIKEGSLVAIGADDTAKFRSELQDKNPPRIRAEDADFENRINEIVDKKIQKITINSKGVNQMPPKEGEELTIDQRAELEVNRQLEIKGVAELYGKQYKHGDAKLKEAVEAAIKGKHSVEQFKSHLLDNFDSTKAPATPGVDLSESEKREYSLSGAIVDMAEGNFGNTKRSGLVKEVSDFLMKDFSSFKKGTKSFLIPNEYFGAKSLFNNQTLNPMLGKSALGLKEFEYLIRAMDATTAGSGGINLVGDTFRPDLFIQKLRETLALGAAGVTILTGLKENFTIPRQLTDSTYALTTETVAGTESNLTFDQIQAAPNPGTGWVEFTKQLLIQSNPSIDALVRESLMAQAARGKDYYGLAGGTGITGLLNESGVYPVTLAGAPTWAEIVEFEKGIEDSNANIGDIKWLINPAVKAKAKTTPKISGSEYSGWLMETNGDMNGYPSIVSTILNRAPLDGDYMFLGVWAQMMLCLWGATEIQVNPFSKDTQGIIRIVLLDHFDWIVRQPASFAITDDVNFS